MNSLYVKEERPLNWGEEAAGAGAGETPPQAMAMEGVNGTGAQPFLNKTYDLVDDLATNCIVSWGSGNNTFVVWDPQLFSLNLLPRYFKHSKFSSFVRQLNTYGFRKVDADKWEFANEGFLRGKKHPLKNIKRKKASNSQTQFDDQDTDSRIELGRPGVDAEINLLKRDKRILMEELLKLRQEQQASRAVLEAMEERIIGTERKQKRTKRFLVRALPNQRFVQELIQQKYSTRKELAEAVSNKKRRPIEHTINFGNTKFGEWEGNDFCNNGLENYHGEVTDVEDSGLDRLGMEMQLGGVSKKLEEGYLRNEEGGNGGLDQRFWEG